MYYIFIYWILLYSSKVYEDDKYEVSPYQLLVINFDGIYKWKGLFLRMKEYVWISHGGSLHCVWDSDESLEGFGCEYVSELGDSL